VTLPSERLSLNGEKAISFFVQQLQSRFDQDVIDVRLFGSRARGQARSDSDLDILVLVTRPDYTLKHAILWLAAETSLQYDVLISPRVIPIEAWETMGRRETLFYRDVHAEGIPLLES
jgi:predicted nucleotidyltransferase